MNLVTRQIWVGIRVAILGLLVLGLAYPLAVTGIGRLIASGSANGSVIRDANGIVVGSSLIGQNFSEAQWFHPRPSAAGSDGYDATSSGGSNLGPNNDDLLNSVNERKAAAAAENGGAQAPPDALTASGSGLDPDISPAYAAQQIDRVAQANDLSRAQVASLVTANTNGRELGYLGEPRVNVLQLNLDLSHLTGRH